MVSFDLSKIRPVHGKVRNTLVVLYLALPIYSEHFYLPDLHAIYTKGLQNHLYNYLFLLKSKKSPQINWKAFWKQTSFMLYVVIVTFLCTTSNATCVWINKELLKMKSQRESRIPKIMGPFLVFNHLNRPNPIVY